MQPRKKAKNKGLFKPSQAFILACYSNHAAKQTRRTDIGWAHNRNVIDRGERTKAAKGHTHWTYSRQANRQGKGKQDSHSNKSRN